MYTVCRFKVEFGNGFWTFEAVHLFGSPMGVPIGYIAPAYGEYNPVTNKIKFLGYKVSITGSDHPNFWYPHTPYKDFGPALAEVLRSHKFPQLLLVRDNSEPFWIHHSDDPPEEINWAMFKEPADANRYILRKHTNSAEFVLRQWKEFDPQWEKEVGVTIPF